MFAKSKDLIIYTLQITNNTERFPKKVRFTLTNRLQDKTLLIHGYLIEANEIHPVDAEDLRERKRLLRKVRALCKQVSFLIEYALMKNRIEEYQASHWAGLVEEVQDCLSKGWMQTDSKRFSEF